MILDYSQFITEKGTKGIVNFVSADRNASVFRHDSICPFCRRKIENVVYHKHKYDTPEWLFGSFEESEYVIQCESCGWWEYNIQIVVMQLLTEFVHQMLNILLQF